VQEVEVPTVKVKVKGVFGWAQQIWFGVVMVTRVKVAPMSVHVFSNFWNFVQPALLQGMQAPGKVVGAIEGLTVGACEAEMEWVGGRDLEMEVEREPECDFVLCFDFLSEVVMELVWECVFVWVSESVSV